MVRIWVQVETGVVHVVTWPFAWVDTYVTHSDAGIVTQVE